MAISLISIILLAIISRIAADNMCSIVNTDDDKHRVYSCVQATLDDVDNIPDDAEWIQFTVSKLPALPKEAFARFPLRGLSFYNCEIGHIDQDAFDGLHKLERLTFYGSNIHVLKASWFKELSSLTHLFLDRNNMVYIEPNVFLLIPNLVQLNIEDNDLNCLSRYVLAPLKKLKHVRFGGNPWLCSCYAELMEWMKNQKIDYGLRNTTKERLECMMERGQHYRDFKVPAFKKFHNISVSDTGYIAMNRAKDVMFSGEGISALSKIPDNVRSIKFICESDSLQIPEITRLAFLRFGNSLKSLYFSNCNIREIHPDAFAGLPKLKLLFLFGNNFSTVKSDWFNDLESLEILTLDENGIEYIEPSVFPMLDKLYYWSLGSNKIQCISTDEFSSLEHLNQVFLAHNPWNCSCQEHFRKWLHEKRIRYTISRGKCINGLVQDSKDLFEQSFENRKPNTKTRNSGLNYVEIIPQTGKELYDKISTDANISEAQRAEITEVEAEHNRSIAIANYELERLRVEQQRQYHAHVTQFDLKNYMDSKTGDNVDISPRPDHNSKEIAEVSRPDDPTIKKPSSSSDNRNSYVSVGGTIWDVLSISSDATAIRFQNSAIPRIFNGIFSRFGKSLRRLEFSNCMVQDIEPQAFNGLTNLRELILSDNHIKVVKSAWFEGLSNLLELNLARNFITRIDKGVFQLLTNLEQLHISNNQLSCLEVDGLSHLKNLNIMDIANNPWSCLCQRKLNEWLDEHEDSINDFFDDLDDSDCSTELAGFRLTNNQDTNSIDIENFYDDNEKEIEKPREIEDIKIIHGLRKTQETVSTTTEKSNIQRTGDTDENDQAPTSTKPEYSNDHCRFHQFNQMRESRWLCKGGDISILDKIPESAERIDIIEANIPVIPNNTFVRFSNLTKLLFYNSSIRDVEPLAFTTLDKLEWLIFLNNSIPTIRSLWFHDLANVTLLGLVRNSITEIESDVFEYLPNLKQLALQENNIRCIYTKSLSSLKYLQKVTMQDNPWKWRCREELTQFFEARNVSYIQSEIYEGKRVVADLY